MRFNEQFSVVASDSSHTAFIPVTHTLDLNRLLSVCIHRKLYSGSTVSIQGLEFKILQNQYYAKTDVTILLSEKHGLRALINGEFFPIEPLSKTELVQSKFPSVLIYLLDAFLYKNAKAA